MQISLTHTDPAKAVTQCLVLFSFSEQKLCKQAQLLEKRSKEIIKAQLIKSDFHGKSDESCFLLGETHLKAERVLLIGLGEKEKFGIKQMQQAAATAVTSLIAAKVTNATLLLPDSEMKPFDDMLRETAQAAVNATYSFTACKSDTEKAHRIRQIRLAVSNTKLLTKGRKTIKQGVAIAQGMSLAKELANLPGNICTPAYLARQASSIGRKYASVSTKILNEKEMKKLKMGSLLSVSRGSRQPAKLIVMDYKGGKKGEKPVVLVGKGLTFDAGGISIKPSAKMDEMKYDMCGGASVFGAMTAIAEMQLPLNVIAVVPSSENLPDGDANKPGDIVTSMAGVTIEILNTDAEGRLILCDALTYCKRFNPDTVIDIATLTGACIVALGNHASGMMANNDAVADALTEAGNASNDRIWRLPLWDDYQPQLDSNFADIANIGGPAAGTITAGCFLSRFTDSFNWAHLDIAGTAWTSGNDKGATGRPVPLLVNYLINKAQSK